MIYLLVGVLALHPTSSVGGHTWSADLRGDLRERHAGPLEACVHGSRPRANGALPDTPLPQPLQAPSPTVLDKVLTVWRQLRKPANVLILMDTSGSMGQNAKGHWPYSKTELTKLDLVQQAHGPLLDGFTDRDRVGLWHFSDEHVTDDDLAAMGTTQDDGTTHRAHIEADVAKLSLDHSTALYTTIGDAVKTLRDHYDTSAINAVLVLTDGKNDPPPGGQSDLEGLLSTISGTDKPVRVFTIAYGADADTTALQQIADATHAHAYKASDPNTIANVLTNVVSNF
ncbi:VWA domain-containing protein [Streptomyces sp. NPDC006476]|uniref:VWA domain-containing protein n=1 Tax=Streptomyces sp. NPDC006476 TaxID=3157175 RepID=UPI0033B72C12